MMLEGGCRWGFDPIWEYPSNMKGRHEKLLAYKQEIQRKENHQASQGQVKPIEQPKVSYDYSDAERIESIFTGYPVADGPSTEKTLDYSAILDTKPEKVPVPPELMSLLKPTKQ